MEIAFAERQRDERREIGEVREIAAMIEREIEEIREGRPLAGVVTQPAGRFGGPPSDD